MTATDDLLRNAEAYAQRFDKHELPAPPARRVAVLACMDARLAPMRLLGLQEGDAHVIRNAGGVVSDDAIRSLAISQNLMGTREIVVIQHTGCGMLMPTDDHMRRKLKEAIGEEPAWPLHTFSDLEHSVRETVDRLHRTPFIPHKGSIRGFVYEVETGKLREVT
ncbi:MAG TPA: carbonic anhydrase [Thermoleophilaceae bacterium]|nr:carbonic anhydrase [Thermoleophilaceae bacterium]